MHTAYRVLDLLNECIGRVLAWGLLLVIIAQAALLITNAAFWNSDPFGFAASMLSGLTINTVAAIAAIAGGYALLHGAYDQEDDDGANDLGRDRMDIFASVALIAPLALAAAWLSLDGALAGAIVDIATLAFTALLGLQALSMAVKAWLRLDGDVLDEDYLEDEAGV